MSTVKHGLPYRSYVKGDNTGCMAILHILFHKKSRLSRFSINTVYLKCGNLWRYIFKVGLSYYIHI
jgi:hypothetical protein